MKRREQRRPVLISARMRLGARWGDVSILNISSRGLMIHSAEAPERGTYLEVRRGCHAIIARVVWTDNQRFGVRTQEPLSVEAIIREPDLSEAGAGRAENCGPIERRVSERRRLSERHEHSRMFGRAVEFACLGIAGGTAALACYGLVAESFSRPLSQVTAALAPK